MARVAGNVMINETEHKSIFIGIFNLGFAFNSGVLWKRFEYLLIILLIFFK